MQSASGQLSPELANACVPMAVCPRPIPLAEAIHPCSDQQPVGSAALAAAARDAYQLHGDRAATTPLSVPEQAAAACHQQQQQEQLQGADQGDDSCDASDDDQDQNDTAVTVLDHDHPHQVVDQEQDYNQLQDNGADQDDQEDQGMDDDMSVAADDAAAVGDQVDGADLEGDAAEELPNHICMVDGCDVDLAGMKPYFRRSKICPAHQSAATVLVSNQECRFCQQCTRCHPVDDFDGVKRSCRSQLLHHNKSRKHRRRCTPGSFYSSKRVRSNHGVAKKKAVATTKAAAATNRPAAATKSAGAAAAAMKAARSAAAVQALVARTAEVQPTWKREACSKPGPIATTTNSRSAAKWKPAADASPAAAAAMPGYDPRKSTSGSRSRFANMMSYEYNTAAATGPARQVQIQHHGLMTQYSADTIEATAATGPMSAQHLLHGFRSLPNPLHPGYICPSVMSQGFDSDPRSRALPPQALGLGYSNSNPDLCSRPGSTPRYPRFQGAAPHGMLQSSDMVQNTNVLQAAHELRYNTSPMAVPGSRSASITGVMTDQVLAKAEDDLNPSCSSCSSKGSPHMPAAAATVGGVAAGFSLGRSVTTMQPQQQLPWQQQQQQQQQMAWQQQTWMQPRDDMPWQQQQQQLGVQSAQPAAAGAANTSAACRKDVYRPFESVGLPQQLPQQQWERRHLLQPTDAPVYDSGHSYDAWGGMQQQEHQHQQQYQQQQQHMSWSGFAAMLPQQQQQQQQHILSSGTSGRLQFARQLARQVAAAAASAGAAGAVKTGVRAMLDSRHQQQQQYMQTGFPPQQHQQQQEAAAMLLQQQHSSPDVSAGSTCAPGAQKQSPQEVHAQSFAPGSALTATRSLGYTVAPYTFGQQQQRAAQQQQQGTYGLAAADVVVGMDGYSKGFANPSWATPGAAQASLAENPSSNPSDATHAGGFDRQISMTSHNAGPLPVPAAVKHLVQQVPGTNPLVYKNMTPGFNSLNPHLMGLDVPALAALVGGCLDSDLEDAWLLDAFRSSDDKGGDPLMETLGELEF